MYDEKLLHMVSGLSDGYWEKDVDEFIALLDKALLMLDTLGQIQATVGGLTMAGKASDTFSTRSHLDTMLNQIRESRLRERKAKGR